MSKKIQQYFVSLVKTYWGILLILGSMVFGTWGTIIGLTYHVEGLNDRFDTLQSQVDAIKTSQDEYKLGQEVTNYKLQEVSDNVQLLTKTIMRRK
jgi:hypothetical protein